MRLAGYMVLAVVLLLFTWWNGLNQRCDGTEEFGDLLLGHRRQVVDCHLLRRDRNSTQINAGRMDAKSDELLTVTEDLDLAEATRKNSLTRASMRGTIGQ